MRYGRFRRWCDTGVRCGRFAGYGRFHAVAIWGAAREVPPVGRHAAREVISVGVPIRGVVQETGCGARGPTGGGRDIGLQRGRYGVRHERFRRCNR